MFYFYISLYAIRGPKRGRCQLTFLFVFFQALMELNNKLSAAERAIAIADEKLREHDIVDENLANQIAKMRMQTQAEFRRFQDEAESAYQSNH